METKTTQMEMTKRPDLTWEEVKNLKPFSKSGLYAIVDGERVTPTNIYFSTDTHYIDGHENENGGEAFYHFYGGLTKAYDQDGNWYREPELLNVCARYKDGLIYDFRRG